MKIHEVKGRDLSYYNDIILPVDATEESLSIYPRQKSHYGIENINKTFLDFENSGIHYYYT